MSRPTKDLPEFTKPPVIEVVLGVQFSELGLRSVHFGQFWQTIRDRYSKTEDRPPLDDVFDRTPPSPATQIVAFEMPPLRRVFFIDETSNFLLQLQPSRFLANWRKVNEEGEYPRFPAVESRFLDGWTRLNNFLEKEGLDHPTTNQYELTYINHIVDEGSALPGSIHNFVPLISWRQAQSTKFLPTPRFINTQMQFPLPDGAGTLHVSLNHATRRRDGKGIYVLEVVARGPAKADASDMRSWFALAHEGIVRGFTDLTSPSAHEQWGRKA